jgi:hypothetical protein
MSIQPPENTYEMYLSLSAYTDWLIMMAWDCLRTAAINGPAVHPPGDMWKDMWTWRAMAVMMLAGDNSWLIYQSSLAVLPAETSGASRRNGRRSENFAYQYLKYFKESFNMP